MSDTEHSPPASTVPSTFDSPVTEAAQASLLPRSAWPNRLTYLKLVIKAKQQLDLQESSYT